MIITQNVDSYGCLMLSPIDVVLVGHHLACPSVETASREEIIRIMISICFSRKPAERVIAAIRQ